MMATQIYNPPGRQLMRRTRAPRPMPPTNNNNSSFFSSIVSAIMYLFSSSSVLFSNIAHPPPNTNNLQFNAPHAIEYHPRLLDKTEEWKDNEWKNWMGKLEGEWVDFNNTIEKEKGKWLNGKEKDWDEFIQYMDNKWMHYHDGLDEEVKSDILKRSLTLDEIEWKDWIKTEGKELMEKDWKNWITNNESYLDVWSVKEWLKWKNQRIVTWIMTDWKCEEDEYWSKWEESWAKSPNMHDRTNWLNWRERLNKEMVQWNSWVMMKEQQIRENRSNNWSKWKSDKHVMFNLWMDTFINKWINEKQWFVWVKERNQLRSRGRYLAYK
ncbi:sporozoite and liver stage tryptophan-rich protein, putative [Plasmodium vivax]|uniref:Sporozoite and liver stage tryptophan-rich protein, putative n=1 Tax=Plasmodium vivax TaxID=5855 RepID=A0A564ZR48_PLAVI|nr:sporozoite and liver stage tryptophan-rich protein, putative [Plasmodium vivax]